MHHSVTPPPALRGCVDAFWQHDGTDSELRVLPDGCMDFVFDLERGTGRVIGAMTEAALVRIPRGARLFGVRFLPGALAPYLIHAASELVDADAPLEDVTPAPWRALAERIADARDQGTRHRLLGKLLLGSSTRSRAPDRRVRHAVQRLRTEPGRGAVRGVALELGLSERQLERVFATHVGIGPKVFARVARLERALSLLGGIQRGQATLAAAAGYADESHLIREFRVLARATPSELARERHVGFVQAG